MTLASVAKRMLGKTGIEVSVLGLGAGPLGCARLDDGAALALVASALDRGVTLFDTAPSYGSSAATVGRDDILGELDRAKVAGKIRASGYPGGNEALAAAVSSGQFDVIECSVSPFDRGSLGGSVATAAAAGMGVLAKRTLGNAAWRFESAPGAPDVRQYWERARAMAIDPAPLAWPELALRVAAFADGVSTALVGTASTAHLADACAAVARPARGEERCRRGTVRRRRSPRPGREDEEAQAKPEGRSRQSPTCQRAPPIDTPAPPAYVVGAM